MDRAIPHSDSMYAAHNHRHKEDISSHEICYQAEITSITSFTETARLYRIQLLDSLARDSFTFRPGQFVMLEVPGVGEAPFSISSSPSRRGEIELCIRNAGTLTSFLSRIQRGLQVGISGPYGTSFPVNTMKGADILFVAGGLGIVALRSPLLTVIESRSRYGRVDLLYGARSPEELLFADEFPVWRSVDIGVECIVDTADSQWSGPIGQIPAILSECVPPTRNLKQNCYAIVCGPPVMFTSICNTLLASGLPVHHMFVSLERRMHCGRGKCCRCNIGSTYTCMSGPVFDYWSIMNLKEAI